MYPHRHYLWRCAGMNHPMQSSSEYGCLLHSPVSEHTSYARCADNTSGAEMMLRVLSKRAKSVHLSNAFGIPTPVESRIIFVCNEPESCFGIHASRSSVFTLRSSGPTRFETLNTRCLLGRLYTNIAIYLADNGFGNTLGIRFSLRASLVCNHTRFLNCMTEGFSV
jgi:hypothetical protein